jgi:hypothetical protein
MDFPWNSMDLHGIYKLHGDPWKIHGGPWMVHGCPWMVHRGPRKSMEIHGGPWRSVESPWRSMEFINSMEFHKIPWRSMEIPWNFFFFFFFYGSPWNLNFFKISSLNNRINLNIKFLSKIFIKLK